MGQVGVDGVKVNYTVGGFTTFGRWTFGRRLLNANSLPLGHLATRHLTVGLLGAEWDVLWGHHFIIIS